MTAAKRVRLPPEERRAQLLSLGLELLAERTLDELSIEDLADAAGVSRGLLFHYFAGKADFQLQVARAAADDLIARTAPDPSWEPDEALTRSVGAFVDYVGENPQAYLSLVRGAGSGDAALREVFDQTRDRLAQRTVDVMTEQGLELPPMALMIVRGWIAFVEDVTVTWCTAGPSSSALTREQLLELLARGLPALVMGVPLDVLRSDGRLTRDHG
ncbi:TetR/AcrR family transcriptional regulator [Jatrophihabitans sp. YIM 134969]